jgi:hypothetical protein
VTDTWKGSRATGKWAKVRDHRLQPGLRQWAAIPRGALSVHDLVLAAALRDRRGSGSCQGRTARARRTGPGRHRAHAGRWYVDVSSGVPPKQFIRGEWFVTIALLTGISWVVCDSAGLSTGLSALIAFVVGYTIRVLALYYAWKEPLAKEPKGVYRHDDGRPMLGRKLKGKSVREMASLGLTVGAPAGKKTGRRTVKELAVRPQACALRPVRGGGKLTVGGRRHDDDRVPRRTGPPV